MIDVAILTGMLLVFGVIGLINLILWMSDEHHKVALPVSIVMFLAVSTWLYGAFQTEHPTKVVETEYDVLTIEWDDKQQSYYDDGTLVPLSEVGLPNADGCIWKLKKTESKMEGCWVHLENQTKWELVKVDD